MGIYNAKRAMLANIIDYAGTFPPAALSLIDALTEAATFRRQLKNPWIVSKMALPLIDLTKLTPATLADAGADGTPWLFTALGGMPEENADSAAWARSTEWELREIERFNDRGRESSCRQEIIGYEIKLPARALASDHSADDWIKYLSPVLERFEARSAGLQFYVEVPITSIDWTAKLCDALCIWMEEEADGAIVPGLKVRTGGKEIPSSTSLAHFIDLVVSRGLKFKATQGLHEAMTHGNSFGFVNLLAALNLAQAIGRTAFPAMRIEEILRDERASNFVWKAESFSWKEFTLDSDKIENARRYHAGCFGSCSIVEPDQSLTKTFPD